MQMFGIGLPELMLILILSILVVGPERLPQVAADLATWIRRARAYGQHLSRDFNDVIGEIERETGATREDWKEIANVVRLQTGSVTREIEKVTSEVKDATRVDDLDPRPTDSTAQSAAEASAPEAPPAEAKPSEAAERPWYETDQPARMRPRE
jgi:sec-independent protein translocase protein TatB